MKPKSLLLRGVAVLALLVLFALGALATSHTPDDTHARADIDSSPEPVPMHG